MSCSSFSVVLSCSPPEFVMSQISGFKQVVTLQQASKAFLREAEGLLCYGHLKVDSAFLKEMPNLKVVSNHGVGVDHIDLNACKERGVKVGSVNSRALKGATADMAMALLTATARKVTVADMVVRGKVDQSKFDPFCKEVHHSTIGIVGLGAIGTEIARRAMGHDMKVLYHNRRRNIEAEKSLDLIAKAFVQSRGNISSPKEGKEDSDCPSISFRPQLSDLLSESDFVVLICPLTDSTRKMIGKEQLSTMKKSSILINIARGGVVDTDALFEALSDDSIAGAGLDVTDPEPLPLDHPLLTLPPHKLVLAPHLGSSTLATRLEMAAMTVENLRCGLAGQEMPNRIA